MRKKTLPAFQAVSGLAQLSWSEQGPKMAQEFLSFRGIKLVTELHFDKTYLDGAAIMDVSGQPVIGMTLRYDRLDNFWFTLMHEVAHIALHLKDGSTIFFDDLDSTEKDPIEHEADRAAADALIENSAWSEARVKTSHSEADCVTLARELKIHPAIVAGRLRHESKNYSILSNMIANKMVRNHFH